MDVKQITWLVHPGILRYTAERLPAEIRAQGMSCLEFDIPSPYDPPELPDLSDQCVVLYGPIEFLRRFNPDGRFQPGNLGKNDRTNVTAYMSNLPLHWFMNWRGVFTTWSMFKQDGPIWLHRFHLAKPVLDRVFIRPNSGFKTFTGQCIRGDEWAHDIETMDQLTGVMDETLIMVAPPIDIQGEFRFVIADGKVIAGSEYRWDGKLDVRRDYPAECFEMAKQVAEHPWQVDVAYTCDVALTNEGAKLVELNGFSAAGLYACDIPKVVTGVSAAAYNERFPSDLD